MLAIPLFFLFILLGLGIVAYLQWQSRKNHPDRGHKGDAHKTPEEEDLHKHMKPHS